MRPNIPSRITENSTLGTGMSSGHCKPCFLQFCRILWHKQGCLENISTTRSHAALSRKKIRHKLFQEGHSDWLQFHSRRYPFLIGFTSRWDKKRMGHCDDKNSSHLLPMWPGGVRVMGVPVRTPHRGRRTPSLVHDHAPNMCPYLRQSPKQSDNQLKTCSNTTFCLL